MEMKLTDVDGVLGKQHLISSVVSNYVTYHVVKASQHMWILDDFQHVRLYHTLYRVLLCLFLLSSAFDRYVLTLVWRPNSVIYAYVKERTRYYNNLRNGVFFNIVFKTIRIFAIFAKVFCNIFSPYPISYNSFLAKTAFVFIVLRVD